jgi:hypothetical protein
MPFRIVGRAIVDREGHAHAGLQVIGQIHAHAGADRGEREPVARREAVVPDRAALEEAVELIALQPGVVEAVIEAQLERACHAVVAARFAAAVAAPEGGAAEIELLRGEQRRGRGLCGAGQLHRPDVAQRLDTRRRQIEGREFARGAVVRQIGITRLRGAEDAEPLPPADGHVAGAAEIVLQLVVRREADGADMVVVDQAVDVGRAHVAPAGRRREGEGVPL